MCFISAMHALDATSKCLCISRSYPINRQNQRVMWVTSVIAFLTGNNIYSTDASKYLLRHFSHVAYLHKFFLKEHALDQAHDKHFSK